jgi:hypothetical protein
MDDWQAAVNAFKRALESTDAKTLLLTAEAAVFPLLPTGANGVPATNAASAAIGTLIGYPLSQYDNRMQGIFRSIIGDHLVSLRPLAQTISGLNWYY